MDERVLVLDGHGDVKVAVRPPAQRERDLWVAA